MPRLSSSARSRALNSDDCDAAVAPPVTVRPINPAPPEINVPAAPLITHNPTTVATAHVTNPCVQASVRVSAPLPYAATHPATKKAMIPLNATQAMAPAPRPSKGLVSCSGFTEPAPRPAPSKPSKIVTPNATAAPAKMAGQEKRRLNRFFPNSIRVSSHINTLRLSESSTDSGACRQPNLAGGIRDARLSKHRELRDSSRSAFNTIGGALDWRE
jgi:hypothetical protein